MPSALEQLRALEEKKQELLKEAKAEALSNAKRAVSDLNSLGFSYKLVEDKEEPASRKKNIKRRVLETIESSRNGLTRRELIEAFGARSDKKAQQSVSNALYALKKDGVILSENGRYKKK